MRCLVKTFLKRGQEPPLYSAWCLRSCPNSSTVLWLERGTCQTWGIYPELGARAVITPGATLSGPALASWFQDRKLGDGNRDTFDQSDWCPIYQFCQAWISLLYLPDPRAKRNTVLKVKCFKGASLIGSRGVLAGARPVRSSRRVCHSCLWVCLWGNYPGDERDFCPSWCWKVNFPICQQWVTYKHQWC